MACPRYLALHPILLSVCLGSISAIGLEGLAPAVAFAQGDANYRSNLLLTEQIERYPISDVQSGTKQYPVGWDGALKTLTDKSYSNPRVGYSTKAIPNLRKQVAENSDILFQAEGSLSDEDDTWGDGSRYDAYEFQGKSGQIIRIILESDEFDAVLLLEDASGEQLAQDKNGTNGSNAEIVVQLPEAGSYRIVVYAHHGLIQGAYRLTVIETVTENWQAARQSLEADRLYQEGQALYNQGQFQAALALLLSALDGYQQIENRDVEVRILNLLGDISWYLSQYSQSLEYAQSSLSLARELGDAVGEAGALKDIGDVYNFLADYIQALDYYEQSLIITRDIGDREGEASTLNNIGIVYRLLGDYLQSLDYYEQSLTLARDIDNRKDEARALNNIGNVHQLLSDYPQALDYYKQSLVITRDIGDRVDESRTLNGIGSVYQSLGDYPQALDYYEQSLIIISDIGDRAGEAHTLNNIGNVYQSQGDYSQTLAYYNQSLVITRDIGDRTGEAHTLNNIGIVYEKLGGYSQALDYFGQSLDISRDIGNPMGEADTLNNIGIVYEKLGGYSQALDYFGQSLDISRDIRNRTGEADTLNNIGIVYEKLGDYPQALIFYEQSLVIKRDIGDRAGEGNTLNNLGVVYESLDDYSQALEVYEQSLAIKRDIGDLAGQADTFANIGIVHKQLEEHVQSLDSFQQGLSIAQDIDALPTVAIILYSMGDLFKTQNQSEVAIAFYKQSINTYETIRTTNRSLTSELQDSYTATVEDTYRQLADLLLQQDRVLEAQRVLDLLRVQELDDYLRGVRGTPNTVDGVVVLRPEEAILEHYNELQQTAVQVGQELQQLRQTLDRDRSPEDQQRIDTLVELQIDIKRQFRDFASLPEVQEWIAELSQSISPIVGNPTVDLAWLSQLRDELQQLNAAIIYPFILEDRLEIVITVPNSPPLRRTVQVPRTEVNGVIAEFRSKLGTRASGIEQDAGQLYDWLIRPIEADLQQAGVETLIYAPDGHLRYVPLAALWNRDTEQWVVQQYRINNITADSLTDFTDQPQPDPSILAGAFADPELHHSVPIDGKETVFRGLPYAGQEVKNLDAVLPNIRSVFDQGFSLSAIQGRIEDYDILHFATHAAFLPRIPEKSFILFGNGDRPTVLDIADWPLYDVDLVVLSACETGIGSLTNRTIQLGNGSEILGMGYQFQTSGARAVIASLWKVDDGGTQSLMDAFYRSLTQEHITKAEALRQAQIALIEGEGQVSNGERGGFVVAHQEDESQEQALDRLSHPYYWAPFILIGNGL
ncbi:MAG: tetratricopeptide repeat protein [Cyanobacteria bacterium P01_F01_bin.150]